MNSVKKWKVKTRKKMKFLTKFIKEHRTLSLTVLVGVLLVASGIYLATIQIQAVPPDPTWEWAKKVGAAGGDDRSKTVARDDAGNVYVAGGVDRPIIFSGAPALFDLFNSCRYRYLYSQI